MQVKRVAATCVAGILALSLGAGMVGCGNANNTSDSAAKQEATSDASAEKTAEIVVLGIQKDGATEIALKNGLSAAFNALSLKAAGEQAYKDNLVPSGKSVAAEGEAKLYVESPAQDATYDIRLTKADGSSVEFLAVPLPKIKSLTLKEADGKYYVDYVETDGKSSTTKDVVVATGTAAAVAAASDSSSSEEETSAQAEPQDEAVDSVPDDTADYSESEESYSSDDGGYADYSSYDGGGSVSYEAPAAAPAAPAQSADSCAPDVVLR